MWFTSAICFSWSWILRNVDFGEKLLWFVRCVCACVCVVEGQQGDGSLQGDFPYCTVMMLSTCLPTECPSFSFFHSFTPTYLPVCFFKCVYMSISMFVQKLTCMQYLLLAATMYMAKYLHVSQAFRPSLVPTVRPLTNGSQPILSSYRMRQCRTWGG